MKNKRFLAYFFSLFIATLEFSIFADTLDLQEAFQQELKANDTFYQELKKFKNPTPEQIQDLKQKIFDPPQENFKKIVLKNQEQEQKKRKEENKQKIKEMMYKINQSLQKLPEEERQKIQKIIQNAEKGIFIRLPLNQKKSTDSSLHQIQKELNALTSEKKEEINLDPAEVPKEVIFRGSSSKDPKKPEKKEIFFPPI